MRRMHNENHTIATIHHRAPKNANSVFCTKPNSPTPAKCHGNITNKTNTFVPIQTNPKTSSIVSPAVAQQADKVFGPRLGNQSSVVSSTYLSKVLPSSSLSPSLSSSSLSSANKAPAALSSSTRPKKTLVSELPPATVETLSKTSNITPTAGTVIQTNIEGSPVPQYLGNRDYYEFISCITTAILAKKYAGDPKITPQLAIMHAYAKGDAGRNIVNFQNMAAKLDRKTNPFVKMDVTSVIAADDLNTMPPQHVDKLKKLPGTRLVNVEESMVLPTVNPALENKLILRDETKPLSPEEKLSNLSGNSSPDFKLEHPVPCRVGNVIENRDVFYDLKNSESPLKAYNQVRNFSKNLEKSTIEAHEFLEDYLQKIVNELPVNQRDQVKNLTADLNEILNKFKGTGMVTEMAQSYNHLLDKYSSLFAGNNIPMNLVTKIDVDSFLLDPQVKQDFMKVWDYLAKSPNSPARDFCLSYFQTNSKPIFNDSFILVKPFLQYLEANPQFKDIIFE